MNVILLSITIHCSYCISFSLVVFMLSDNVVLFCPLFVAFVWQDPVDMLYITTQIIYVIAAYVSLYSSIVISHIKGKLKVFTVFMSVQRQKSYNNN